MRTAEPLHGLRLKLKSSPFVDLSGERVGAVLGREDFGPRPRRLHR